MILLRNIPSLYDITYTYKLDHENWSNYLSTITSKFSIDGNIKENCHEDLWHNLYVNLYYIKLKVSSDKSRIAEAFRRYESRDYISTTVVISLADLINLTSRGAMETLYWMYIRLVIIPDFKSRWKSFLFSICQLARMFIDQFKTESQPNTA